MQKVSGDYSDGRGRQGGDDVFDDSHGPSQGGRTQTRGPNDDSRYTYKVNSGQSDYMTNVAPMYAKNQTKYHQGPGVSPSGMDDSDFIVEEPLLSAQVLQSSFNLV